MKILRHIAPYILMPILLVATVGFSIEIHFCGDEIKSIGLYEAEACQMEKNDLSPEELEKLPPCHQKMYLENQKKNKGDGYGQDSCCHDEQLMMDTEDTAEKLVVKESNLNQVQAVLIYTALDYNLFNTAYLPEVYEDYKPPLLQNDITVLQQVFRI